MGKIKLGFWVTSAIVACGAANLMWLKNELNLWSFNKTSGIFCVLDNLWCTVIK